MRRLALVTAVVVVVDTLLLPWTHTYRGSDNAGIVVCGIGVEVWGHPGPFMEGR